jgi:hypothetical protein
MLTLQDLLRTRTAQPPLNKAMYFNGVNSYVEVPDSPTLQAKPPFTVCAWIFPLSFKSPMRVFGKGEGYFVTGGWTLNQQDYPNLYVFWWNDGTNRDSVFNFPIDTGKWSFFCAVFSGNQVNVYVNGAFVKGKTTNIFPTGAPGYSFYLGRSSVAYYSNVLLGEVLIYKSLALNQAGIQYNMNNPNNPIRDGLVLWLDARACDTSKNICWDLSGNGNHGAMYNVQIITPSNPVRVGGTL